jgi:phosphatidylethanolamine/phosphatidyl-N-methylethanolamine N-methyltransferase
MLHDYRLFFQEFRRNYHTTGAISPSSRWLAAALTRYVDEPASRSPRQILEVGPGTGAVTQWLVKKLRADDELTLVELNDQFVERLQRRLDVEPPFRQVAGQVRLLHQPVEALPGEGGYDLIISGLPLNNFAVADVERILATFSRLVAPSGTVSFFEYIAVRRARTYVGKRHDRQRLAEIDRTLNRWFDGARIRRDWIWPNLPPAWVHHVRPKLRAASKTG